MLHQVYGAVILVPVDAIKRRHEHSKRLTATCYLNPEGMLYVDDVPFWILTVNPRVLFKHGDAKRSGILIEWLIIPLSVTLGHGSLNFPDIITNPGSKGLRRMRPAFQSGQVPLC